MGRPGFCWRPSWWSTPQNVTKVCPHLLLRVLAECDSSDSLVAPGLFLDQKLTPKISTLL